MTALWAIKEAKNMSLKDTRRNARAAKILEAMAESPATSIPNTNDSWAETKAMYRFIETPDFDEQEILEGHYKATYKRLIDTDEDVIILSDGMDISLQKLKQTSGLGPIGKKFTQGILTHNTLVLNKEFVPLGLINIKYWVRDAGEFGKRKLRQRKAIQDKESFAWIESIKKVESELPSNIGYTYIGDGGADIYDVFTVPRRPNGSLLIHLTQDRNITFTTESPEKKLLESLDSVKPLGMITVALQRTPTRAAREAKLEIKVKIVDIKPPVNRKKENLPTQQITAISACEVKKSKSKYTRKSKSKKIKIQEPIVWRLLSTTPAVSLKDAADLIYLYAKRWLIERYHYILKEGCHIEKLQMESAENLKRTVALYSIVAWRLMYITYIARISPKSSCTLVFTDDEWQALWCYFYKKKSYPSTPPTIKEAVFLLAKLGGFLARKGDGNPGAKVIWRGLIALDPITEMFAIFKGKNMGKG